MSQAAELAQVLNVDRPTLKWIYEKTRLNAHPESPNFLLLGRDLAPNEDLTEVALQVAEDAGWLPALALALLLNQQDNVSAQAQTKLRHRDRLSRWPGRGYDVVACHCATAWSRRPAEQGFRRVALSRVRQVFRTGPNLGPSRRRRLAHRIVTVSTRRVGEHRQ